MRQKTLPKITIPYGKLVIENKDDFVKIAEAVEFRTITEDKKFLNKDRLFHSSKGIIEDSFYKELKAGKIFKYLKEMNISCFSFDLGPGVSRVSLKERHYYPEGRALSRKELLKIFRRRLEFIKVNFKGKVVLENFNYFKTGAYENICEPDFINQVLEENDVLLLLDIGHAIISTFNLGLDIYDYLNKLPLKRIFEIHLSRPDFIRGNIEDLHRVPNDNEYELLYFLLKHSSPLYIAIEYCENKNLLLEAYKILRERLERL